MKFLRQFLNIDQAENDGAGGGAGGEGSQGGGAGAGAGGGQEGAANGGGAGGGQEPDGEQHEIKWGGETRKVPLAELKNLAQQGYDFTKNSQANSETRKKLLGRLSQVDTVEAELKAAYQARMEELERHNKGKGANNDDGGDGGDGDKGKGNEGSDEIKSLRDRLDEMSAKDQEREWKDIYSPAKQKFSNLNEERVLDKYLEKQKLGELNGSPEEAMMEIAAEVSKEIAAETGVDNDKRLDAILADAKNPKLVAHNKKVIEDFIAKKGEYSEAGGDNRGGGGGGGAADKQETIAEAAARLRA